MARTDFTAPRLFVGEDLADGAALTASPDQASYLRTVLRLREGARVLVFNGRDGEWAARVALAGKRGIGLTVEARTREQSGGPDIDYLFAPLKRARLDYLVQKATEMGVWRLRPVVTQHTVAERVNLERMRANVVEAAEQCGILRLPEIVAPQRLDAVVAAWPEGRRLIFCDEDAPVADPVAALAAAGSGPVAVLVGPEGGFSAVERAALQAVPGCLRLSLGPRILRADTAAVAVLALVNAVIGDWRAGGSAPR